MWMRQPTLQALRCNSATWCTSQVVSTRTVLLNGKLWLLYSGDNASSDDAVFKELCISPAPPSAETTSAAKNRVRRLA